ncbi:MAG: hypothetical protein HDR21_12385 [Lachnospiraceae bacterium]|nr:hypothetical protein [Lachnospiraceae bacterium]MBD5481098.1 hypothetical protein [Lachnospiraceae bacterium]
MKLRIPNIVVLMFCLFVFSGCSVSKDNSEVSNAEMRETNAWESTQETDEEDMVVAEPEPEELLDAFLAGEIPAFYDDEDERGILFDQLSHDEDEWDCHSVGERIDLDNDGENEQIVNGPYGGIYFDARDGKVYVLAEGEGTAGVLSYAVYDHATWIVHSDTTHGGRQTYWLTRYDGGGNIADEFKLGAEYWESPDDTYDENSEFTYRDEEISMEEYEELIKEIFGW